MPPNPYVDEDLQALAEHARRFARGRVAPGFLERDQHRVLDRALLREMGALGVICPGLPERLGGPGVGCVAGGGLVGERGGLGLIWWELPERVGGQGLGCLAAGVIHEEIARADLSFSYLNLLASLNGQILSRYGAPEV